MTETPGRSAAGPFRPAPWLRNAHCQTVWPTLAGRDPRPAFEWERLDLADGDFLDLAWCGTPGGPGTPTLLVLHGLEGSCRSRYVRGLSDSAARAGWRVVVMHFRGCGRGPNRLDRGYHSGDTADLAAVVEVLRARWPDAGLYAAGYSLGGNVLLKWLGESNAPGRLQGAVAVSVPLQLDIAADRLQRGLSRFYQWWLLRSLKRKVREKFGGRDAPPIDVQRALRAASMREFDDAVTAPLHGFAGAEEYYRLSSARQYLRSIDTPTLVVQALDDPFMTPRVIPSPGELSSSVTLEVSRFGGHVGFVEAGSGPGRYWIERRILDYLSTLRREPTPLESPAARPEAW